MKTRMFLIWLVAGMLAVSAGWAQHSAGLLASYQDASDGDAGIGILARYQYDLNPAEAGFRFFVQAGQYTGFGDEANYAYGKGSQSAKLDMDLIAIEAAALYDYVNPSGWTPYVGVGAGYYIPDPDYSLNATIGPGYGVALATDGRADADNAFGFFALAGVEKKVNKRLMLFAELRYSVLEITVEITGTATASTSGIAGVPYISRSAQHTSSSDVDLGGLGASIGAAFLW